MKKTQQGVERGLEEFVILYPKRPSSAARVMRVLRRHYAHLVKRGLWTMVSLVLLFTALAVAVYGGYTEIQNDLVFEAQLRAEEGHMAALQEQFARHAEEDFVPLQVTLDSLRIELASLRPYADEHDGGPQGPAHAQERIQALHRSLAALQERFDFLLEKKRTHTRALQEQFDALEERFDVLSEDYTYEHLLGDYYEQQLGLTAATSDPLTVDWLGEVCRLSHVSNHLCP